MMLQALTGVIYDITVKSWSVISILAKYYIAATAIHLYTTRGLTRKSFEERVLRESRIVVLIVITSGIIMYLSGITVSPVLKLFSELAALSYLAYLFWQY